MRHLPSQIKKLQLLGLLIFAMNTLFAQEGRYIFDSYSVNEGLSQSVVNDIIQDDQGFMWIANRDGVNRFDGYVFNEYRYKTSEQNKAGVGKGNLVANSSSGARAVINRFDLKGYKGYGFYKNSRGQLLLSHNNGISLYDPYRNTFRVVLEDTSNLNERERDRNIKYKILGEDTAAHQLWIWRPLKGLYVLDNRSYAIKRVILYPPQFTARGLVPGDILKDGNQIWMNFEPGELLSMNTQTLRLSTYCLPGIGKTPVMHNLNADSMIIACAGHILMFNKKQHKFTDLVYTEYDDKGESFEPAVMELDHNRNVWIGGSDGVLIYSIRRNELIQHITTFNTFETRSLNNVRYLYRDAADNMWVGTSGDGIKKYSPIKRYLTCTVPPSSRTIWCALFISMTMASCM